MHDSAAGVQGTGQRMARQGKQPLSFKLPLGKVPRLTMRPPEPLRMEN